MHAYVHSYLHTLCIVYYHNVHDSFFVILMQVYAFMKYMNYSDDVINLVCIPCDKCSIVSGCCGDVLHTS